MPKEHHPAPGPSVHLRGTVRSLNISPKGHVEGAILETTSGVLQINFPKGEHEALGVSMKPGSQVDLRGKLESDEFEHRVYRVTEGADGAEARGKIVHLNYALHGEVNGCQLDDGTFVHLKPEAAKKQHLRVGEQIVATGTRRLGAAGTVLEARSVERSSTSHGAAPRV